MRTKMARALRCLCQVLFPDVVPMKKQYVVGTFKFWFII